MIIYWTDASTSQIRKVMGSALARTGEPHRFASITQEPTELSAGGIVVALGTTAVDALRVKGVFAKKRTITSLRNVFIEKEGVFYTAMFDPGIVDVDAGKQPEIEWDVQLIARMHKTGSVDVPPQNYLWVEDFSALIERVKAEYAATQKPVVCSFDTETIGLIPFVADPTIVVVQISDKPGTADCWYVSDTTDLGAKAKIIEQINWILNTPMIRQRGANLKYDFIWVKHLWGLECTNFTMDTLLFGSLLNENRSNSLNMHTKIYAGAELGGYDDYLNANWDKSRMDLVPKSIMLPYAGGDVDSVLRVSPLMLKEASSWPTLPRFYLNILHPAARVFEKIERMGILVDPVKYEKLRQDLVAEIARLEHAGLQLIPYRLRLKYADDLNLGRAALLKDYFFTPMGLNLKPLIRTAKTREPSTAKHHLEMFHAVPEAKAICAILGELNSATKVLSTYVLGFLKHLRIDSRFHASYLLHAGSVNDDADEDGGTNTGRLSARGPAIQTVPKKSKWAKRIRECLISPPGYTMVSCDYAQGELKIAACLADEEAMLTAYLNGIDLHAKTGAGLVNMELDDFLAMKVSDPEFFDSVRGRAKPANFGLLYGMGEEGYQRYSWAAYGLAMTLEESATDRNAFFNTYPGLFPWHNKYKALARENGYVMSPLGRVRHLPLMRSPDRFTASKEARRAVNSPVQSTLSDLMIWALAECDRNYEQIKACAMIHDAGIFYVPEDHVETSCQRITTIMSDLPIEKTFGWKPQLRFTADAEAGPDMGHLKKVLVH